MAEDDCDDDADVLTHKSNEDLDEDGNDENDTTDAKRGRLCRVCGR